MMELERSAGEPFAHLRFLVVEDHSFQRWALGQLLTKLGATNVLNAGDGEAALELYSRSRRSMSSSRISTCRGWMGWPSFAASRE